MLQHLLRPTRTEEVLAAFYRDFAERNGARPTAVETYHAGFNPRSNSERSWFGFVERMEGLEGNQLAAWSASRDFFASVEKTETTRSYKIVLLLAMLDDEALVPSLSIGEITRRVSTLIKRMHGLTGDFSVEPSNLSQLQKLLIENPIRAFVGAQGMSGVQYFTFDGEIFAFAFGISDRTQFGALLREVLDWRLAQYLSRSQANDVVCRVARNATGTPILFLPSDNRWRLPEGPLDVEVEGRAMEALVAKIAVNVLREPDGTTNELPSFLRQWFGEDAGLLGRSDRVRFRKGTPFILEPVSFNPTSSSSLTLWERYLREAIPPAYGLQFNRAIWNVGFVVSPPHIFLLVTLAKEDMNPDHQYSDHFISDEEFNWQSRN